MNISRGFTLIELMIVVAIIGILAAIAIPQYQDHIIRAQVSRLMHEVSGLRSAAEHELLTGGAGKLVNGGVGASTVGFLGSTLGGGGNATDLQFGGTPQTTGQLTMSLVMGVKASNSVQGTIVGWERGVDGSWKCVIDSTAAANWKASYCPSGCWVGGVSC